MSDGQLTSFIQNMSEDHVTDLKKGILGDAEWHRRWREGESHWHNNKNIDPYVHHLCLHQYYHLNLTKGTRVFRRSFAQNIHLDSETQKIISYCTFENR